jgi:GTP-binding protein
MSRLVAIVGRPNVGKSRLFNRLAGKRISIVHDQPGVTRDLVLAKTDDFQLIDTGGLGLSEAIGGPPDALIPAVEAQARFAIEIAQLILLVVDAREGVMPLDEKVAGLLRRSGKPVLLVANKHDHHDYAYSLGEFYRLGFGPPFPVSAEHGIGERELRDAIYEKLGPAPPPVERTEGDPIRIVFAGRPNVGKSSLSNRLLGHERLLVSNIPGTTRDAVELDFEFSPRAGVVWRFRLVDTAGIRAATKLGSPVEYFSRTRSLHAIEQADVVFVVLDAMDGVTKQDQAIAGEVIKAQKPVIVLVNKWDLVHAAFRNQPLPGYKSERDYREKYEASLRQRLFFTPGAPVIFVSALTGAAVERMLRTAHRLDTVAATRIPTGQLNAKLIQLTEQTPPPAIGGRRFRVYYAVHTGTRPFRIKIFCNQARRLDESYRRYLENGLIEEFNLAGCPIHFDLIGKERSPKPDFIPGHD